MTCFWYLKFVWNREWKKDKVYTYNRKNLIRHNSLILQESKMMWHKSRPYYVRFRASLWYDDFQYPVCPIGCLGSGSPTREIPFRYMVQGPSHTVENATTRVGESLRVLFFASRLVCIARCLYILTYWASYMNRVWGSVVIRTCHWRGVTIRSLAHFFPFVSL